MADIAKWGADVIDGRYYVFEGQELVAECYGTEEDAHLIAAAPDMYELLDDTLWFLEQRQVYGHDDFALQAKSIRELLDRIKG